MRIRQTGCILLALVLVSSPTLAQQPIQDAARHAASAAAAADNARAQDPPSPTRRGKFLSGMILGLAGGAAVILGTTVLKSADTTSGNTPEGAFDSCVALTSNPVYRGNDCDVLKGPNTALVIGGAIAAATGATLMMLGTANNSVAFGPSGVSVRHRVRF